MTKRLRAELSGSVPSGFDEPNRAPGFAAAHPSNPRPRTGAPESRHPQRSLAFADRMSDGTLLVPSLNPRLPFADACRMDQLPTRDDLLRRKASEQGDLERPRLRALAIERDLAAARAQCWELLDQFTGRVYELGIEFQTWRSSSLDASTSRIIWIEGYPLTNGAIVSLPPLRYCVAERRRVRRPQEEMRELNELSIFVPCAGQELGLAPSFLEPQTASSGGWPHIERLEYAASVLNALRIALEKSLFALMG